MNDTVVYMVLDDATPVLKITSFSPSSNDPNLTSPEFNAAKARLLEAISEESAKAFAAVGS